MCSSLGQTMTMSWMMDVMSLTTAGWSWNWLACLTRVKMMCSLRQQGGEEDKPQVVRSARFWVARIRLHFAGDAMPHHGLLMAEARQVLERDQAPIVATCPGKDSNTGAGARPSAFRGQNITQPAPGAHRDPPALPILPPEQQTGDDRLLDAPRPQNLLDRRPGVSHRHGAVQCRAELVVLPRLQP
jgi:hypothetical protein